MSRSGHIEFLALVVLDANPSWRGAAMSSSALEWIEENPGKTVLGAGVLAAAALCARSRLSAFFCDIGEAQSGAREVGMGVKMTAFQNGLRFESPDGFVVDVSRPRLWCGQSITARCSAPDTRLRLTGSDAIIQTPGATIRGKDSGSVQTLLADGRRFKSRFFDPPDSSAPIRAGDTVIAGKTVSGDAFSLRPHIYARQQAMGDSAWVGHFGGHHIDSVAFPTISMASEVHVSWAGLIRGPLRGSGSVSPWYKTIPFEELRKQLITQV